MVFIAQNYHKLIPGRKVSFCTDHHLLLGVLGSSKPIAQSLPPHTSRWCGCASLYLYYNILRYRAGKTHQSVDALSRLTFSEGFEKNSPPGYVPLCNDFPGLSVTAYTIAEMIYKDPLLSTLCSPLHTGRG